MRLRQFCFPAVIVLASASHHSELTAQTLPVRSGLIETQYVITSDTTSLIAIPETTYAAGGLFPLTDAGKATRYWGKNELAALQNLSASIATNHFSLYSEFVSDFLIIGGNWCRISFGGLLSKSDTNKTRDSTSAAVERFFGAGGNALINIAVPVVYARGKTGWGIDLILSPKIAADLPAMSTGVSTFTGSYDLGADVLVFVPSVNQKISIFGQARFSWVHGSGDFYRNLGLDSNFGNATLYLGVTINNAFRISAGSIILGPLRNSIPWQVGVQMIQVG